MKTIQLFAVIAIAIMLFPFTSGMSIPAAIGIIVLRLVFISILTSRSR